MTRWVGGWLTCLLHADENVGDSLPGLGSEAGIHHDVVAGKVGGIAHCLLLSK